MSLIICPECRSEVSSAAAACPKCGFPFAAEQNTVIVTPIAAPPRPRVAAVREVRGGDGRSFPNWVFVPIALALVLVIFGFIWMMSDNRETANDNGNVRLRETAAANTRSNRTAVTDLPTTVNSPTSADSTVVVPPAGTTTLPPNVPATLPPANSETVTTAVPVDKGNLDLTATVAGQTGIRQAVRAEKFYLLSKDLEEILARADVEAENGSYATTFGAAIADPSRKEELQKCLAAIKPFIVVSTTSDSAGKASFKNVKPDSYYLFGVHKTGNTASVWNTSVTVNPGENTISLNGSAPTPVSGGGSDGNY